MICLFLARRWRGTSRESALRHFIAIGCVVVWLISTCYRIFFLPFDWESSLPLQFCNLANLIGAIAIFGKGRLFKSVIYFWAGALCIWAYLTPELPVGPARAGFWIFWGYHVFIPLAVVEVLVLQQFRPGLQDYRNALIFTLAYLAILIVPNNLMGWNYGFVGPSEPQNPTLIDFLGPYPLRLLWMILLGAFLFWLLLLPWLKQSKGGPK